MVFIEGGCLPLLSSKQFKHATFIIPRIVLNLDAIDPHMLIRVDLVWIDRAILHISVIVETTKALFQLLVMI